LKQINKDFSYIIIASGKGKPDAGRSLPVTAMPVAKKLLGPDEYGAMIGDGTFQSMSRKSLLL
jgi:hypothetical protein